MAARTGMTDLIVELRARCDAGTADYESGGITFWTADQLQNVLDRNRTFVRRELLQSESEWSEGTLIWRNYLWAFGPWVEAVGDADVWRVEMANGSAIGTASYVPDYSGQRLRFTDNTHGLAYYLTYRTYDLNRAAAEVWEDKAANVAGRFDIKTDNHDLKRSQLKAQYLEMADQFRRRAGARVSTRVRDDLATEPRHDDPFKPVNNGEEW